MDISGVPSRRGIYEDVTLNNPGEAGCWYLSKKEIEENSPSKRDGIDLKKEAYLRKAYCTFLQDLGMRLKVPQVTIATAIIFCHRFFLRHSHATNDRRTIATVCMFLAGKVEETPRPLKDVILVSYEINHKNDPAAAQRIKHKEVFEEQKEMILVLERLLLATLAFDLNLIHPYKPLVEAIKKFKVAQHALAQVAWNFVNDGLRTSLCLQFKPHHIAAGAIFLAAKFLKVKLPSDGEKVWWQEFDVTPRQLEEVSNQMLELYEQNRSPPSQDSEIEGSAGGRVSHRAPSKVPTSTPLKSLSPAPENTSENGDSGIMKIKSCSNKVDCIVQENQNQFPKVENKGESVNVSRPGPEELVVNQEKNVEKVEMGEAQKFLDLTERISESPREAIKKIDKDKFKAALEKRRKFRGSMTRKMENMDEDDLIERELEDGIELAAENEKIKQERRQSWCDSKPSNRSEDDISDKPGMENVEEGEVCAVDEVGRGSQSPESSNRKRKVDASPDNIMNGKKQQHENFACENGTYSEDKNRLTDQKRHLQENHV